MLIFSCYLQCRWLNTYCRMHLLLSNLRLDIHFHLSSTQYWAEGCQINPPQLTRSCLKKVKKSKLLSGFSDTYKNNLEMIDLFSKYFKMSFGLSFAGHFLLQIIYQNMLVTPKSPEAITKILSQLLNTTVTNGLKSNKKVLFSVSLSLTKLFQKFL